MNAAAAILIALTLSLAIVPGASATVEAPAVEARTCISLLQVVCFVICLVSPRLCAITAPETATA